MVMCHNPDLRFGASSAGSAGKHTRNRDKASGARRTRTSPLAGAAYHGTPDRELPQSLDGLVNTAQHRPAGEKQQSGMAPRARFQQKTCSDPNFVQAPLNSRIYNPAL